MLGPPKHKTIMRVAEFQFNQEQNAPQQVDRPTRSGTFSISSTHFKRTTPISSVSSASSSSRPLPAA